jgi:hypothetical protein
MPNPIRYTMFASPDWGYERSATFRRLRHEGPQVTLIFANEPAAARVQDTSLQSTMLAPNEM